MKNYEVKIIAGKLAAYPLGMLQDFVTFVKICEEKGISIEEVREYIKSIHDAGGHFSVRHQSQQLMMDKAVQEKFPVCPLCENRLMLEPVNDDLTRMVDDHSHSWWVCPDIQCPLEPRMNDKRLYEILSDMGIMVRNPRKSSSTTRRKKAAIKKLSDRKKG